MKYIDFLLRVFAGCFFSVGVFNVLSPNGKDPVIYFLLGLVFLLLLSGKKKEASKEAGDALIEEKLNQNFKVAAWIFLLVALMGGGALAYHMLVTKESLVMPVFLLCFGSLCAVYCFRQEKK